MTFSTTVTFAATICFVRQPPHAARGVDDRTDIRAGEDVGDVTDRRGGEVEPDRRHAGLGRACLPADHDDVMTACDQGATHRSARRSRCRRALRPHPDRADRAAIQRASAHAESPFSV